MQSSDAPDREPSADHDSPADREPSADPTAVWWPGLVPVAAVLVVAAAAAAGAATAGHALVVADADTGERLLVTPVEEETTVVLAYTHSVEKTPVRDVYAVEDGRLVMTRMAFKSFGWGLPSRADVEVVDGWFVTHPDWRGDHLYVTPGRIAGHTLHVDDRTYDLVALSDAETVRIAVVDRSVLDSVLAAPADVRPPTGGPINHVV